MHHNTLYRLILSGDKSAAEEFIKKCKGGRYYPNPRIGFHSRQTLFQRVVQKNLTDIALYFMEHGVEINTQDKLGNTPLHEAAKNGNNILIEELLKKGANSFTCNTNRMTAGMLAARNHHLELAFRLHSHFIFKYPNFFFSSSNSPKKSKVRIPPPALKPQQAFKFN